MPVGYVLGDHRLLIIDFLKSCLVGASTPSIVRLAAKRLNSRILAVAEDYSGRFQTLVLEPKLIERLEKAHESISVAQIVKENINKIDIESKLLDLGFRDNGKAKCQPEAGKAFAKVSKKV